MKAKSDMLAASRRSTKTKAAPQVSSKIRKSTIQGLPTAFPVGM
jgi:hypothetical protein